MDLADRYRTTVAARCDAAGDAGPLLPKLLAEVCVTLLPVQGAGISFTQELRIPLGASDETASRAERLQSTLDEGPCLTAVETPLPLAAGQSDLARRWPMFHSELLEQTPYRSVVSLPLLAPRGGRLGALDLYSTDPEPMEEPLLGSLGESIGSPMAAMLLGGLGADSTLPGWLSSAEAQQRMTVWSAVGILLGRSRLDNADALAVLRGHAFAEGTSLDEVAARLVRREIEPEALIPSCQQ